jgi:hypothetical protein
MRYETEDAVSPLEPGETRGATALDPESAERAKPRLRQSGFPIDPNRVPSYSGSSHGSNHGSGHGSGNGSNHGSGNGSNAHLRISSQITAEPRRGSQITTDPRRSSQMATDPSAGPTRPFQRARGKRYRVSGEHDPHHTQTFGPAEPLPPMPAGTDATDGWFEPSLRTEAIPDLIGLVGDTSRTYDQSLSAAYNMNAVEETQQVAPLPRPRPLLDLHARPWMFPVLLATTCLAVGMVLGALLFGNYGDDSAGTASNQRAVVVRCSDPPVR